LKSKAALAGAGLFAGLLVVELLLRAGGAAYRSYRLSEWGSEGGGLQLLCLGDSWTFGVGAGKGGSYPEVLERTLTGRLGRPVHTVNGGVPGRNSSEVFADVEDRILEHRPQAVVLLIGVNDEENFNRSNYHLFIGSGSSTMAKADSVLSGLRTYKLLRTGARLLSRSGPSPRADTPRSRAESKAVRRLLERTAALRGKGRAGEAVRILKEGLDSHPGEAALHAALGDLLLHESGDPGAAIDPLERATAMVPEDPSARLLLFNAYRRSGDPPKARETLEAMRALGILPDEQERLLRRGIPSAGDRTLFAKTLRYDLDGIAAVCRRFGVRLVLLTYPAADWPNPVIRDAAERHGIALTELEAMGERLKEKGGHHAEDGHFNEQGYAAMAGAVADTLVPLLSVSPE